ncbi:MAG: SRPBCC domain-containing protein [Solirubrobacteraceae bacterium]
MVPERLEREILIEAPVEVVWAVITVPEHLNGWFGDVAELELRPGGRLRFRWEEYDNTAHGRVERVEPPRLFSFRWIRGSGTEVRQDDSTLVEFRLREEGDSTRLTVVESGFRGLSGPEDEKEKHAESHRQGWELELGELLEYVGRL